MQCTACSAVYRGPSKDDAEWMGERETGPNVRTGLAKVHERVVVGLPFPLPHFWLAEGQGIVYNLRGSL